MIRTNWQRRLLLLALSTGCTVAVRTPTVDNDHAPTVSVTGFPVGGGTVDPMVTFGSTTVPVARGTEVMVMAAAKNPGGVHSLSLRVDPNVAGVLTVSTPDAQGNVPNALYILGSDGHEHAGSTVPLTFIMGVQPVVAVATGSNWNAMSTTVTVTYACSNCR